MFNEPLIKSLRFENKIIRHRKCSLKISVYNTYMRMRALEKNHEMHKNAFHKFCYVFYKLFCTVNTPSIIRHI